MTSLWQDVRYSLRAIRKTPGFAALAILTLALGIGANTTIFSWINSALLNPVPGLANPSEVVSMTLSKPGDNPFPFTYPDIEAMRIISMYWACVRSWGVASFQRRTRSPEGRP
jgi:hypothetical protein